MGGKYGIIPAAAIHGEIPKYRTVHTIYVAHFFQKIMEKINKSFWDRSKEGNTDELGNAWKPLSPRTHKYKPLVPQEKAIYQLGGHQNIGLLTPNQRRTWTRYVNAGVKSGLSKAKAESQAWEKIKAGGGRTRRGPNGERQTPINIRTGRLVASTRPGRIANNRYYPPADQSITFMGRRFRLSIDVPYAKDVDKVRPIVPNDISIWRAEAHKHAMTYALREFNRINNVSRVRNRRSSKTKKR